ncbi:MAG: reverse gyrase [Candidatus Odinarchaeia archaeon]
MIPIKYRYLCPVCNGDICDKEIVSGICEKKSLQLYVPFEIPLFNQFKQLFFERVGSELRSIQSVWSKRILKGESFSVIAPTGTGKTLLGIFMAGYLSLKGKKSYLIVPSTLLLQQVIEKLKSLFPEIKVQFYYGSLSKSTKEEALNNIRAGKFDVVVTTVQFLVKNFEVLSGKKFDFVFVDDVDAVLKSSRNVDRILKLLGFTEDEINKGERLKPLQNYGQLIVSTAFLKPGKRAALFRKLLDFAIGGSFTLTRNIDDIAVYVDSEEEKVNTVEEIISKLGYGGIVFTNTESEAAQIKEKLANRGLKIGLITSKNKSDLSSFLQREIDVLIGISSPYGVLVRGLDYPENVRYAIFYGVPVFKLKLDKIDEFKPKTILFLANAFSKHPEISKRVKYLGTPKYAEMFKEILKRIIKEKAFQYLSGVFSVSLEENALLIPDIRTYIQASGRVSRFYAGGITKGASFILDTRNMLEIFSRHLSYYDLTIKEISSVDFDALKVELEESRRKYVDSIGKMEFDIKPALMIVESPTKARQIARFFGRPSIRVKGNMRLYEVPIKGFLLTITASLGHLTDLTVEEGYHGVQVIEEEKRFIPIYTSIKKCRSCKNQFVEDIDKCPYCKETNVDNSKERIKVLMELAYELGNVIIATDPDNEGEKIAFDIKSFSQPLANVYRAEFHEITRKAIEKSLENMRDVDLTLVKSQIARRIEDRWIGFELSSIVQRKFKDKNLSAGRAQTPVLGWIIERFDESQIYVPKTYLKFNEELIELETPINLEAPKQVKILVRKVDEKEETRNPLPPYTTDTLLKDLNTFFKLDVKDSMRILQDLFENGCITYHRTDSTTVSNRGLDVAREFLGEEFQPRKWTSEGAHECIRPTRAMTASDLLGMIKSGVINFYPKFTYTHFKVYDLIFRRFMASQCKPAVTKQVLFEIKADGYTHRKWLTNEVHGRLLELYPYMFRVSKISEGEYTGEIYTRKVRRSLPYTQAEVVSLMKERGIGRPSTYATIINKILTRKYAIVSKNRLIPTKKGRVVYSFLIKKYEPFISENRTRILEEILNKIETGQIDYKDALLEFYLEIKRLTKK